MERLDPCKLFVRGATISLKDDEIFNTFAAYGEIVRCSRSIDRGLAFVTFASTVSANKARDSVLTIAGQQVECRQAFREDCPPPNRPSPAARPAPLPFPRSSHFGAARDPSPDSFHASGHRSVHGRDLSWHGNNDRSSREKRDGSKAQTNEWGSRKERSRREDQDSRSSKRDDEGLSRDDRRSRRRERSRSRSMDRRGRRSDEGRRSTRRGSRSRSPARRRDREEGYHSIRRSGYSSRSTRQDSPASPRFSYSRDRSPRSPALSRSQPTFSRSNPTFSPSSPQYNRTSPRFSPGSPIAFSPSSPQFSPGPADVVFSPASPSFSPRSPTAVAASRRWAPDTPRWQPGSPTVRRTSPGPIVKANHVAQAANTAASETTNRSRQALSPSFDMFDPNHVLSSASKHPNRSAIRSDESPPGSPLTPLSQLGAEEDSAPRRGDSKTDSTGIKVNSGFRRGSFVPVVDEADSMDVDGKENGTGGRGALNGRGGSSRESGGSGGGGKEERDARDGLDGREGSAQVGRDGEGGGSRRQSQEEGFSNERCRLAARNLSKACTADSLRSVASECGQVTAVVVHRYFVGEGMLEYSTMDQADEALRTLNGRLLHGLTLRLQRF